MAACQSATTRLDKLEAPYLPPENVRAAIERGLYELNKYSDLGLAHRLRTHIAYQNNVEPELVVPVAGRIEAIKLVLEYIIKLMRRKPRIIIPRPGIQEYRTYVEACAGDIVELSLVEQNDVWRLSLDELFSNMNEKSLIILDNPSDPTGSMIIRGLREAKEIISEACRNNTLVMIDESFYEFSGFTLVDFVNEYNCLVIVRSMEQAYALAGIGLAYLIAPREISREITKLAPSPPRLSLLAGIAALENREYYLKMVERLIAERERTRQLLLGLNGVYAYRSWANFLLVKTSIGKLAEKLCSRGIAVANTQIADNYVRVTIGNQGDNNSFLAALARLLREESKLT